MLSPLSALRLSSNLDKGAATVRLPGRYDEAALERRRTAPDRARLQQAVFRR